MYIFNFDSILPEGRYKGKTVREVFDKNKGSIFKIIKRYHYSFSDDVLEAAHITKIEHEHHSYIEWEHHSAENMKKLKKDTKSLDEILDEMEESRLKIKVSSEDDKEKKNDKAESKNEEE